MHIEKYYKCKANDIIQVSSSIPENAEVLETMDILTAEEGYELIRIADGENIGNSIWLKDGDAENNYKESVINDR